MFEKCIECPKIGESCVPNFTLLTFTELIRWCDKRQRYKGWTNKVLAEKSKVPEGTISRIKAGEEDCKYSTMRNILITLIGGTTDEFPCNDLVEKELMQMEQLEKQASKLAATEEENQRLKERIEEYKEQIAFQKDEIKIWRSFHRHEESK